MNNQQQSVNNMLYDNLIGKEKLSQYLNVPIKTVSAWVYKRQIPFLKIGRHIRFRFDPDILDWLNERKKDADRGL